ncbi:hypothetical protein [Candidatus Arthromitus sp. SFB-rat-Yit]|uniref:hypothetical protein n=1 Tax=Candidatus Arthromitus sp. SFB-rat-Yit TaxID=1041504 RepID=UPI000227A463|nr:hypothetical protein [Candidatus Arthromitus sp. SFB-rat-Yit]BAK80934.1 hypothetical protein RATSFB_0372 [Candidatus Arthromitus sp. SFB-rat-Yit]
MINKIKNLIMISFIAILMSNFNVISGAKNNIGTEILNSYNTGELIYLINEDGELVRLNRNMKDIVPENMPKLLSINVYEDDFFALTREHELISSENFKTSKNISKIDKKFLLTLDGKVSSFDIKNSRVFGDFKNVKDIKALSDNAVVIYDVQGNISIVNIGNSKIMSIKNLSDIEDVNIFNENLILVIKKDGTMMGFGDDYNKVSKIIESIKNAKKFIHQMDNLYVVTYDNKAIPIIENGFKAPEEYLRDISDITISNFSNSEGEFYKSYFVTTEGKVSYYIQSDNEISSFNKQKIDYINGFDNVEKVYESGYLTIVLHRDGSITIPFNIHHELNGITGVTNIELKNQSYVVYLDNGHAITSLDNIILNDRGSFDKREEISDLYEYFNVISLNTVNREINKEDFENMRESILNDKESFKNVIRSLCLDRKFILIDIGYDEIIERLYYSVLNVKPSSDEYNHILYEIIEKSEKDNMGKEQIIIQIVNYMFENPLFEDIFKKLTQT